MCPWSGQLDHPILLATRMGKYHNNQSELFPGNFSRAGGKEHALSTEFARLIEDKSEVLGAHI